MRKYRCQYCDHESTYKNVTTLHYQQCTDYPVKCPNQCGVEPIKRKEVPAHKLTCPQEPVKCPLHEAGCKAKVVRSELASHMAENSQQHFVDMMEAFTELKEKVGSLESHQQSLVTSMQSIRSEIDYISSEEAHAVTHTRTVPQNAAIKCIKTQLMQPPKIVKRGDSVAFRMTNFKTWQHRGVWCSPPFYCADDFEMCLKVNARQNKISLLLIKGGPNQLPHHFKALKLQVLDQRMPQQQLYPCAYQQQPLQYHTNQRRHMQSTYVQSPQLARQLPQSSMHQLECGSAEHSIQGHTQEKKQTYHATSEEAAHIVKTFTYTDHGTLVANDSIVVQASWPDSVN